MDKEKETGNKPNFIKEKWKKFKEFLNEKYIKAKEFFCIKCKNIKKFLKYKFQNFKKELNPTKYYNELKKKVDIYFVIIISLAFLLNRVVMTWQLNKLQLHARHSMK